MFNFFHETFQDKKKKRKKEKRSTPDFQRTVRLGMKRLPLTP